MMRLHPLSWLGLLVWLSYGVTLWPLPPQEAAETVALYKRMMAEPSPLERAEWESQPQAAQEQAQRTYEEFLQIAQEIIDGSDELRAHLWWEWTGRAGLLAVGLFGWLYLMTLPRVSRAVIAITTTILVIGQLVSHWAAYSELVEAWFSGHSGVKYLPWATVLPMLYLFFVLPILLVLATALAFRLEVAGEVRAK